MNYGKDPKASLEMAKQFKNSLITQTIMTTETKEPSRSAPLYKKDFSFGMFVFFKNGFSNWLFSKSN